MRVNYCGLHQVLVSCRKKVFERAGIADKYDMILHEKVGSGAKWPHQSFAYTCRGLLICIYIYTYIYGRIYK